MKKETLICIDAFLGFVVTYGFCMLMAVAVLKGGFTPELKILLTTPYVLFGMWVLVKYLGVDK